ncbi:MAG: cell division protein FtsL [Moraxella sp.]|nr:cell division protein FtsL [Moraxella sp.]
MKQPKQNLVQAARAQTADEVGLLRIFRFVVGVLVMAILLMGAMIVKQVNKRHESYRSLQSLKTELNKLQIEEQRLLIEQQTFGATSEVARRATTELNMRLPKKEERRVLAVPVPSTAESK